MLTFLDIQNRVLRMIDEVDDQDTTRDLVKDAINLIHRQVCFSKNWPWMMWPREESFTTTQDVRTYSLNPSLGKLRTLWDSSSRDFATILPRTQWEAQGVDRSASSRSPQAWVFGPVWPVEVQPTSVGAVSIVSDSTLDSTTSGSKVQLIVLDDGHIELAPQTITANGLTPVSTSTSVEHILAVTKIGSWHGTLTIKDVNNINLLSLDAAQYGLAYPTIESTENPTGNREFLYTFLRKPRFLENDYDIPEIHPNDLSEVLVYGSLLELTAYNTELGPKEQVLWQQKFDFLMNKLIDANDENIIGSSPRTVRELNTQSRVRWVMDN